MLCCSHGVSAGYLDDIAYTRLKTELGTSLPEGFAVPVSQVEAASAYVDHDNNSATPDYPVYAPDPADGQFAGKTLTDVSA